MKMLKKLGLKSVAYADFNIERKDVALFWIPVE